MWESIWSYIKGMFEDFKDISIEAVFAVIAVALLVVIFIILGRKKWNTKTLVLGGICVAMSFLLSFIKLYTMPQGGSITPASMLPVMFFAVVAGPAYGLGAGLVYGVLQLLQDMYIINPIQPFFDYIFAFGALGLAGCFKKNFILGYCVAVLGRFVFSFLSGVLFFASYAEELGMNPFLYSAGYQASYLVPELIVCIGISLIPAIRKTLLRLYNEYRPKLKETV